MLSLTTHLSACRYAEKQVGYMACAVLLTEVRTYRGMA